MKDSNLNRFFKRCSTRMLGVSLPAGLAACSFVGTSSNLSFKQLSLPALTSPPLRTDARSTYLKAEALEFGNGAPKDEEEASRLYRIAAEQRYAPAEYSLALMYEEGRGVEKNSVLAVKWYQMAAEQGIPEAQNNLGLLYKHGDGLQQDYEMAFQWFTKAVLQGNVAGAINLADAYRNGIGTQKDLVKAFGLYQVAALTGAPIAQNDLALMFANGEGVEQNYVTAYAWMSIAAKELSASSPLLEKLRNKLSPEDLVEADQARKELELEISKRATAVE